MLNHLINSTCSSSSLYSCSKSEYAWLTWYILEINVGLFLPAQILAHLWRLGYAPEDVIGNIFRVCKTFQMPEYLKLEFIKVSSNPAAGEIFWAILRGGCDS